MAFCYQMNHFTNNGICVCLYIQNQKLHYIQKKSISPNLILRISKENNPVNSRESSKILQVVRLATNSYVHQKKPFLLINKKITNMQVMRTFLKWCEKSVKNIITTGQTRIMKCCQCTKITVHGTWSHKQV